VRGPARRSGTPDALRVEGVHGEVHARRAGSAPEGARATLLVDGDKPFQAPGAGAARLPQEALVKGDGRAWHIAAASVLAKVSRDAMMERAGALWPGYGLEGHKGYPTPTHREAVARLGPSPIHRLSFRGAR
jgi:ribonuclease HII